MNPELGSRAWWPAWVETPAAAVSAEPPPSPPPPASLLRSLAAQDHTPPAAARSSSSGMMGQQQQEDLVSQLSALLTSSAVRAAADSLQGREGQATASPSLTQDVYALPAVLPGTDPGGEEGWPIGLLGVKWHDATVSRGEMVGARDLCLALRPQSQTHPYSSPLSPVTPPHPFCL